MRGSHPDPAAPRHPAGGECGNACIPQRQFPRTERARCSTRTTGAARARCSTRATGAARAEVAVSRRENKTMFSRFFIDRPIFAAVISVFLVLAGLSAMRNLPIAQYPEIAPPVVTVSAVYPGASAEVLEQTVASPIENAVNGVPNTLYLNSNSTSQGVVQLQVTFEIGTNVDEAAINVNHRVKQVEARLPQEVR